MGGILWAIIIMLFVFWVFGVFVAHLGRSFISRSSSCSSW